MFNPTYLAKSRCGVFYLRWPIPKPLHPHRKASTLKISLRTRDPRKALRLSRALSQVGELLNAQGIEYGMRYDELREVLTAHFRELLEQAKAAINENGPLGETERQMYVTSKIVAKHARETDTPLSIVQSDDELLSRFISEYDLPLESGSTEYGWLGRELKSSYHAFAKAVLAYNKSFRLYDLDVGAPRAALVEPKELPATAVMSVAEIASAYTAERLRGQVWAAKTVIERADHIKLLTEILGADTDVRSLTSLDAKRVKDTLLAYPRNRAKNPLTRGKPLNSILGLPGVALIQTPTINKYLQTYQELFEWAKQNHHAEENLFSGLTLRRSKKTKENARDPYTDDQIRLIIKTITHNEQGLVTKDYQKWASLIGIFTGARLGEIAQLHLKDIREQDGIWVFDMNDEGDRKSLKTTAARRLVPIHRELLGAGLLEYVDALRGRGVIKLFPDFSYDARNGWGRQQSRWFNNRLLVELELKTKTRVFHSLRHTVNTRLLQAGVAPSLVKAIIGHEQEGMTYKQYFKEGYTIEQLSEAMQKLSYSTPAPKRDPAEHD